jgi:beta-lactam-binding protein with PASTA domain
MADILPYLGVAQTGADAAAWVTLEDVTGLSPAEAEKKLKSLGLTAVTEGFGTQVVTQIPIPGQSVQAGSQVLLYLGEKPQEDE